MKAIKQSLITQHVSSYQIAKQSLNRGHIPVSGDVAVFEVLEIGKHKKLQMKNGQNRNILPGDQFLACFGNRYASAQFEGYVPNEYHLQYHILGQGGVVGIVHDMHSKLNVIGPTKVKLVGYAIDEIGNIINTHYLNISLKPFIPYTIQRYKTILSVGSSMDSGKTTTAAYLARGLSKAGKKTAYIKLTGTAYTKDKDLVEDCGACFTVDFSDIGFPSTYMYEVDELLDLYCTLTTEVSKHNPDYLIIEIADGLLQRETDMLLRNHIFMQTIDHIVLSCGDSLSVKSGINILRDQCGRSPNLISGLITASPLLTREASNQCDIPFAGLQLLESSSILQIFSPQLQHSLIA